MVSILETADSKSRDNIDLTRAEKKAVKKAKDARRAIIEFEHVAKGLRSEIHTALADLRSESDLLVAQIISGSALVRENVDVSQPLPFSDGRTVASPNTQVNVQEDANQLMVVPKGVSIGEVVNALNALGVTPRDLIAIFQAIKAAGALQADLEVI